MDLVDRQGQLALRGPLRLDGRRHGAQVGLDARVRRLLRCEMNGGIAMAARIPMMMMTTRSSTREKPLRSSAARARQCIAAPQLMRLKTEKIGMYSAMIMPPMSDAEHDDHERLDERRELLGRRLDLLVVELGDLLEHRVERAGVLTDRHHLHDHGREHRVLRQRPAERVT